MTVDSARPTRSASPRDDLKVWALLVVLAAVWGVVFAVNEVLWPWLLGDLFRVDLASTLGAALEFFLYDTVKMALHKRDCRWCLNPPVWSRLRMM